MTSVLRDNRIVPWGGRKAGLACGDSGFANLTFALVKVSFLFADMHDDFRRAGGALIIPPTCRSGPGIHAGRIGWILLATEKDQRDEDDSYNLKKPATFHRAADSIYRLPMIQLLIFDSEPADGRLI